MISPTEISPSGAIESYLAERGISEVRHFTTNRGLAGILAMQALLSRKQLPEEAYIEHIFTPNCDTRKDRKYLDTISLSISRINAAFFSICSGAWHANSDVWWVILGFEPVTLASPGVIFTTTNNIYSNVKRGEGVEALSMLFADEIRPFNPPPLKIIRRTNQPVDCPTDPQAEALYPQSLSTEHLRRIYVRFPEHEEKVAATMDAVGHPSVEIKYDPEAFR
ncbi:DarT ssDNA thymidine ADP-ribosyltransferase family protein [Streptomyces sp. NPDC050982]|uniref:DarT ssDNA thymidine ADP-ribosyltransferase family protein n=1 Tax=Streptomyces sp. NPDC050982 TaxID=3154746 RepID=UPI0033D3FF0B